MPFQIHTAEGEILGIYVETSAEDIDLSYWHSNSELCMAHVAYIKSCFSNICEEFLVPMLIDFLFRIFFWMAQLRLKMQNWPKRGKMFYST